jgi:hypothetical protein
VAFWRMNSIDRAHMVDEAAKVCDRVFLLLILLLLPLLLLLLFKQPKKGVDLPTPKSIVSVPSFRSQKASG